MVRGAVVGFVAVAIGATLLGIGGGMGVGAALGFAAMVAVWGGLGFGAMMGGSMALVRDSERDDPR